MQSDSAKSDGTKSDLRMNLCTRYHTWYTLLLYSYVYPKSESIFLVLACLVPTNLLRSNSFLFGPSDPRTYRKMTPFFNQVKM